MSGPSPVITIDGPAGVGKSTVGTAVARELELPFLDTGIFYRALTVAAARLGLRPEDAGALAHLAATFKVEVNTDARAKGWRARVEGADLDSELWDPELAPLLTRVASLGPVREALLELQRRAGLEGVVAVGRDTGTVVFPDADRKFYLDAPPEVRLERRRQELGSRGLPTPDALMAEEVIDRDRGDLSRAHAPLAVPEAAVVIDTANLSAAEVSQMVLAACAGLGQRPE
ncbi:MAG: (d)CMP kinase [Candidatus Dormibacteria bacterium]